MDIIGRILKFSKNRQLTEEELAHKLCQTDGGVGPGAFITDYMTLAGQIPQHDYLSTIKVNSTYLEVVDRCYGIRGIGSGIAGTVFIMILPMLALTVNQDIMTWGESTEDMTTYVIVSILLYSLMTVTLCFSFYALSQELFKLTHNPIRLNRKTRMVYAFLYNDEVVAVPWDKLFFCVSTAGLGEYDLRAHIMAEDNVTVKQTIGFGIICSDQLFVVHYFEFLKCYMDKGPENILSAVKRCLPIDGKKEPADFGLSMLLSLAGPTFGIIAAPIILYLDLWRILTMATCKVPVWSNWVTDECQVAPDDPYVRTAVQDPPVTLFDQLDIYNKGS